MRGFPVSSAIVDVLDSWVSRLAEPLRPPKQVPVAGGFQWEFAENSERALVVAKSVRMVTGLRGAIALAEFGLVTESASLLRLVSDFSMEIVSVCEGVISGQPTTAQREFVDQFYRPYPQTFEERLAHARIRYVSREDLLKSDLRMAQQVGVDGEHLRNLKRALNTGYDAYVHGSYQTAMELYHGGTGSFMLRGHESANAIRTHCIAIAGKLHEVFYAFAVAAEAFGYAELHDAALRAINRLDESEEYES